MFTPLGSVKRSRTSKTTTIPLNGFFDDGVWNCNCRPRLPAARFEVKKQGPNTGRWFYTCQEPNGVGCKFFLWDETAKEREKRAVMSNSRTEPLPGAEDRSGSLATPTKLSSGKSGKTFEQHMRESTGMMAARSKESDDEFDWPLSPGEEKTVEEAVARASVTPSSSWMETPRKAVKAPIFDTPGSKRKRGFEGPYPTPNTTSSSTQEDVFTPISWKGSTRYDISRNKSGSLSESPTPVRFRDASKTAHDLGHPSSQATRDYDLTEEVLGMLKDQPVDAETKTRLREVLNRHVLKSRGIVKGREISRETVKAKDTKIAELQEHISSLETEREMDRLVIRKLREDVASSGKKSRPGT